MSVYYTAPQQPRKPQSSVIYIMVLVIRGRVKQAYLLPRGSGWGEFVHATWLYQIPQHFLKPRQERFYTCHIRNEIQIPTQKGLLIFYSNSLTSLLHPNFFKFFHSNEVYFKCDLLTFVVNITSTDWSIKAVSCLLHRNIFVGLCLESEISRLNLSCKRCFIPTLIATFAIFIFYFSLFSRLFNRWLGRVSSILLVDLYFIHQLW